jgi:hypothetical protein
VNGTISEPSGASSDPQQTKPEGSGENGIVQEPSSSQESSSSSSSSGSVIADPSGANSGSLTNTNAFKLRPLQPSGQSQESGSPSSSGSSESTDSTLR